MVAKPNIHTLYVSVYAVSKGHRRNCNPSKHPLTHITFDKETYTFNVLTRYILGSTTQHTGTNDLQSRDRKINLVNKCGRYDLPYHRDRNLYCTYHYYDL